MASIESVVLKGYVRIAGGVNGEKVSVLDPTRAAGMQLKETASGVMVVRAEGFSTLVPMGQIAQIIYAAEAPVKGK